MIQLDSIIPLLETYKYLLLFPISVAEGPTITIIAGFLASEGVLNPIIAYLVMVAGDVAGDTIYYAVGRWGGRSYIWKHGKFFGVTEGRVVHTEEHFKNHSIKTLLIGKTNALGALVLAAAGLGKMPYLKFIIVNTLASSVKVLILIVIGYYFGRSYKVIDGYLGLTGAIITGVTILALAIYFFAIRKPKNLDI